MSIREYDFWQKVDKSGDCWEWTAGKNSYGYGVIRSGSKMKKAHRVAYSFDNGPIPDGMQIDHACRNRGCVKPAHLRLATHKQNMENRGVAQENNVTSGVRGVYKARNNKWQARVTHNGVSYSVGHFNTIREAEAAVTAKRLELFTHNELDKLAAA